MLLSLASEIRFVYNIINRIFCRWLKKDTLHSPFGCCHTLNRAFKLGLMYASYISHMAQIFTLYIKYMKYIMPEYDTNLDDSFNIFELISKQNTLHIRIMTVCCSERIKSFWQKLPSWDFTNHYIMHMPPLKSEWGNDSMYITFLGSCCLARIILVTQFSLLHDKESLINY